MMSLCFMFIEQTKIIDVNPRDVSLARNAIRPTAVHCRAVTDPLTFITVKWQLFQDGDCTAVQWDMSVKDSVAVVSPTVDTFTLTSRQHHSANSSACCVRVECSATNGMTQGSSQSSICLLPSPVSVPSKTPLTPFEFPGQLDATHFQFLF